MTIAQHANQVNSCKFSLTPLNPRVHATSMVAALCLVMDTVTSIRSIHLSLYPLYFAKVFLPLNRCALFINSDNCANKGCPCSSCTDLCLLLSPQLCYAQSSYAQRCTWRIFCFGSVRKFLPKIWPVLYKMVRVVL